jgi:hypothetical protein
MIKECHGRVVADEGSLLLLIPTHGLHLFVGVIRVGTAARTSSSIGDEHGGKPLVRVLVCRENSVQRHDFDVVGVRGNGHVSRTLQRPSFLSAIGNPDFGAGLGQVHFLAP